jgi:hypothetical protein
MKKSLRIRWPTFFPLRSAISSINNYPVSVHVAIETWLRRHPPFNPIERTVLAKWRRLNSRKRTISLPGSCSNSLNPLMPALPLRSLPMGQPTSFSEELFLNHFASEMASANEQIPRLPIRSLSSILLISAQLTRISQSMSHAV